MSEDKAKAPAKKAPAAKKETTAAKPAAKKPSGKTVTVTQIYSPNSREQWQRATLIGLGLNRIRKTSVLEDTPSVRGMIRAVHHLVKVEEAA